MRKFDASFTKMRKITSANVLNHELILGRPYIIHYADSSVVIYDDINDSIFTLIDLRDNNSVYHFGKEGKVIMNSFRFFFVLFVWRFVNWGI